MRLLRLSIDSDSIPNLLTIPEVSVASPSVRPKPFTAWKLLVQVPVWPTTPESSPIADFR